MNISRRTLLRTGIGYAGYAAAAGGLISSVDLARAQEPVAPPPPPAKPPKPDPYADAVFVPGPPPAIADGSFTIAVMPDTQNYTGKRFQEQFHAQTEWIASQQKDRRIAAVLHLGDVTNHNSVPEFTVARDAMNKLDKHVPYFMVPGNHDYSLNGKATDRTSAFTEFFPLKKFQGQQGFGGVYDKEPDRTENSFHTFDTHGRKFGVICLEWGPRADVVRWANDVATKLADRELILITHAYMYYDETRYDWKKHGPAQSWNPHSYPVAKNTNDDINDGQELWDKLVSRHENFILTLNGHVIGDGLGKLVTATPGGRDVSQVLVNFQMKPNGGDGWLRLLEFKADGRTVEARDYSPTLDKLNESPQNKFTFATAPVRTA